MPSRIDDRPETDAPPLRPYVPRRHSESLFVDVRGLRYHVRHWPAEQQAAQTAGGERRIHLLHGWMDVSASFQFIVDRLPAHWAFFAPDWRGFGLTDRTDADCYWYPDYLADLDRLLDAFSSGVPADLVAHSMGGSVAALYAGLRPERVRRLVNLEGTGLEGASADQAPMRYREWLDQVRDGVRLRDYPSRAAVAQRLMRNNPRLRPDYAAFLSEHWGLPTAGGRFALAGDPAHRMVNPILYRVDEITEIWRLIEADLLWVLAAHSSERRRFVHEAPYQQRLSVIRSLRRETVADAGHMLHHDQPAVVAALIEEFLS
ncbi:MAG TPA: alpha/beta fold hydrolase [Burkholderiaceae bacterium]|nr:alpha/beta fold hydrolase [Burkholderiaceae bacterium]